MQRIKFALLALLSVFAFGAMPAMVGAQSSKTAVCEGLGIASGKSCDDPKADKTVEDTIKLAIRIFELIIGVIALFTIITAGLNYINSGGDGSKTATAKNRIMYAAIGLIVVALAETIVQFTLNRVPK